MTAQDKRDVLIKAVTTLNKTKRAGLEIIAIEEAPMYTILSLRYNLSKDFEHQNGVNLNFADCWFSKDWMPTYANRMDFSKLVIPENFDEKQVSVLRIAYFLWGECITYNK